MGARAIPTLLMVFVLAGCGHIDRKQIGDGEFEITGWIYAANDRDMQREAIATCPLGWDTLNVEHSRVAEGPVWSWRIRCWLDDD